MHPLSSKNSKDTPFIKSWFGFLFGASIFGFNIVDLFESFSLEGILRTLAFLCFWILWSQMIDGGWNRSITKLFVTEAETTKITCLSLYLPFIPLILLAISFVI